MSRTIVIGGGHNGLVAACYLARAGRDVLVLEQSDKLGGGARTEETIPGFRFDTHSVAHNIINMTSIPQELQLAAAGLDYLEMEPFATGFFAGGPVVRFHRSIETTLASIGEVNPAEARRYGDFITAATPLVEAAVTGLQGQSAPVRNLWPQLRGVWHSLRRGGGPFALAHDLVTPYGTLLASRLDSELTRAPIAAFAAHSSAGPHLPGGAFYAFWQAAYHRYGQWHARGGSQGLIDALAARLASFGGQVRTSALVTRVDAAGGRVRGVQLAGGERLVAGSVLTALDPVTALLSLCDPPVGGQVGADLAAAHRGNAVQMLVHLATDRLIPYPGGRPGDWNGLQSHVESVADLRRGFLRADAGDLPDPPPTYAFTPSALDPGLAPPGQHTVYLACPCAPFEVRGGWPAQQERFARAMIDSVERQAPGFRDSILAARIRSPATMAAELRWPGAHPMVLDISLDQLSFQRPTRALAGHRTPVAGFYLSGAGTAPVGGVAGSPGKAAALALLADNP